MTTGHKSCFNCKFGLPVTTKPQRLRVLIELKNYCDSISNGLPIKNKEEFLDIFKYVVDKFETHASSHESEDFDCPNFILKEEK